MATVALSFRKKSGLNVEALNLVADRFSKINKFIESGKEIPIKLSENFVTFPLSDNPYKDLK